VIHNLTLVHLLMVASAGGCIYLSLREVRRRYLSTWRLFAPAFLALFVGVVLSLLQFAERQPPWPFGLALVAGFMIGGARGMTIGIQHDMYRPRVNLSHAAKLLLLWVAIIVGLAVLVECLGAFFGTPTLEVFRLLAALIAMVCGGAMLGRALLLAIRLHRADRGSA
jgi:hypothetical protein